MIFTHASFANAPDNIPAECIEITMLGSTMRGQRNMVREQLATLITRKVAIAEVNRVICLHDWAIRKANVLDHSLGKRTR